MLAVIVSRKSGRFFAAQPHRATRNAQPIQDDMRLIKMECT